MPATLARHLGLRELVDHQLDLDGAPGRANRGDKMLTLVATALAGDDCIEDADALRPVGRPVFSVAQSRRHLPSGPSYAAFAGGTSVGPQEFPAAYSLAIPRIAAPADGHRDPVRRLKTVPRPPIYPNGTQAISPVAPSSPFRCPHAVHRCPSVDSG